MRRVFHITLLLSVLVISPAFPQSPSTGAQLSGTILDPNGAVVPGARVTLRSETTGFEQSTTGDAAGQYAFLLVPAGQYTLTVDAVGFSKLTDTGVILTVGQLAKLPLTLQLAIRLTAFAPPFRKRQCRSFRSSPMAMPRNMGGLPAAL